METEQERKQQGTIVFKKKTEEDILEEIWRWEQKGQPVSLSEISSSFQMSKKAAGYYLKKMAEHGYIERMPNGTLLRLTGLGRIIGAGCSHRHDGLALFLQSVGASPEEAEKKACRIEHLIGSELTSNICDMMIYGNHVEKMVRVTDLHSLYAYGSHPCMVGIYKSTGEYPRRLLRGCTGVAERGTVELRPGNSVIRLPVQRELCFERMWYESPGQGFQLMKWTEEGVEIPAEDFEFSVGTTDFVAAGHVFVVFGKKESRPNYKKKMLLIVRILE